MLRDHYKLQPHKLYNIKQPHNFILTTSNLNRFIDVSLVSTHGLQNKTAAKLKSKFDKNCTL